MPARLGGSSSSPSSSTKPNRHTLPYAASLPLPLFMNDRSSQADGVDIDTLLLLTTVPLMPLAKHHLQHQHHHHSGVTNVNPGCSLEHNQMTTFINDNGHGGGGDGGGAEAAVQDNGIHGPPSNPTSLTSISDISGFDVYHPPPPQVYDVRRRSSTLLPPIYPAPQVPLPPTPSLHVLPHTIHQQPPTVTPTSSNSSSALATTTTTPPPSPTRRPSILQDRSLSPSPPSPPPPHMSHKRRLSKSLIRSPESPPPTPPPSRPLPPVPVPLASSNVSPSPPPVMVSSPPSRPLGILGVDKILPFKPPPSGPLPPVPVDFKPLPPMPSNTLGPLGLSPSNGAGVPMVKTPSTKRNAIMVLPSKPANAAAAVREEAAAHHAAAMSPMELPQEIWARIVRELDLVDLLRCRKVSKPLNEVAEVEIENPIHTIPLQLRSLFRSMTPTVISSQTEKMASLLLSPPLPSLAPSLHLLFTELIQAPLYLIPMLAGGIVKLEECVRMLQSGTDDAARMRALMAQWVVAGLTRWIRERKEDDGKLGMRFALVVPEMHRVGWVRDRDVVDVVEGLMEVVEGGFGRDVEVVLEVLCEILGGCGRELDREVGKEEGGEVDVREGKGREWDGWVERIAGWVRDYKGKAGLDGEDLAGLQRILTLRKNRWIQARDSGFVA
ncbi:hypothetical protein HDU97_008945 [Phlyctochytrium planicorne]|nr:hypothetical protein HDU97_008945 [Phlyctochytrium planicorne]